MHKYYEAEISDIVEIKGSLGRVISIGEGKNVTIEILEDNGKDKCPHCGGVLKTQWDALERSPLFQESVKLVKRALHKFREKWNARVRLRYAVKIGKIVKPEVCDRLNISNIPCSGRIEAHHYNGYEDEAWKEVWWLCVRHHHQEHDGVRNYGKRK